MVDSSSKSLANILYDSDGSVENIHINFHNSY